LEWSVQSPAKSCVSCGKEFAEREDYWSALLEDSTGFVRMDYCGACWQASKAEPFSFWRTRSAAKPAPPKRFVDDQVLLDFFQRLSESTDAARERLFFIMAVLLLRKRLLKEKSRRRDERGSVWVLEAPRLGKEFLVRDESLSDTEILDILSQIGQVLNLELSREYAAPAGSPPA